MSVYRTIGPLVYIYLRVPSRKNVVSNKWRRLLPSNADLTKTLYDSNDLNKQNHYIIIFCDFYVSNPSKTRKLHLKPVNCRPAHVHSRPGPVKYCSPEPLCVVTDFPKRESSRINLCVLLIATL